MLGVGGLDGTGRGLVGNRQGDVAVEVDGDLLVGDRRDDAVVDELADTAAGHDLVAVAVQDVGLLDHLTVGVVPAGLGAVLPGEQSHAPGELEDAGGGQVDVLPAAHAQLGLAARAARAPGGHLTGGDDDDQVIEVSAHLAPLGGGGLSRDDRGGQGLDDGRSLALLGGRGGLCSGVLTQGHEVDVVAQPPGEVGVHRCLSRLGTHLGCAQTGQLGGDLLGGPGTDSGGLDRGDKRVVAAHESGALDPADAGVGQRHALGPGPLRRPAVDDRVQGGLDLAVGAVTAEGAPVRGSGQHHVETVVDVGVCADGAQGGDGALHRPQQQSGLRLRRGAGVGQCAGDARCGEGEQERGNQGLLDDLGGATGGDHLVVADPLRQGVDVAVGGQVRGNHPQLGTGRGVLTIEGGGELEALVGQA